MEANVLKIMSIPKNSKIVGKTLVVPIELEQTSDETETNQLRISLREMVSKQVCTGFVINLHAIKLLASEYLALFVELHQSTPYRVKLCNVHPNILETLSRTQLIQLLEVVESEEKAIKSLCEDSVNV